MLRKLHALFKKKQPRHCSNANSSSLYVTKQASAARRISNDVTSSSSSKTMMTDQRVHGSASAVNCVVIAEPDKCLSVSSVAHLTDATDPTLVLSNPSNGTIVHRWNVGHHHGDKEVTKVACCHRADVYATGSRDKMVNIWARNGSDATSPVARLVGHELVVTGVAVDGAGTKIFSGSRDNTVRVWNVDTGLCVRKTALAQNLVTHVRWGGGDMVAQSSEDKTVHLWDVRNMEAVISTAPKHHIQTWCDLDEPYVLTCSNGFGGSGCEATLWDARIVSRPVREFRGHSETVSACCFVRSQQQVAPLVATCSRDSTVRLWNGDTGECLSVVTSPESGLFTSMASYSDFRGSSVLVSSINRGIEGWSVSIDLSANNGVSLQRVAEF